MPRSRRGTWTGLKILPLKSMWPVRRGPQLGPASQQARSSTTRPWWWGPSGWMTYAGGSAWLLGRGPTLCPWGTEGKHKSSHPPDGPCLRTDLLKRRWAHPVHLADLQLESPQGARWDLCSGTVDSENPHPRQEAKIEAPASNPRLFLFVCLTS